MGVIPDAEIMKITITRTYDNADDSTFVTRRSSALWSNNLYYRAYKISAPTSIQYMYYHTSEFCSSIGLHLAEYYHRNEKFEIRI